jgi:hypothetical protein
VRGAACEQARVSLAADGQGAASAGSGLDGAWARDWEAVRASADIQFAPVPPPAPRHLPEWLRHFGEWLEAVFGPLGRLLGLSWPVLEKVLAGLGLAALAVLAWVLVRRFLGRQRKAGAPAVAEWEPDRAQALALLEDADRLAAQGDHAGAVHLLLLRSVGQIAAARADWVVPSSTARELSALPGLPERARAAFAVIAGRVERSRFALRALGVADWEAARAAYAGFALAELAG